MGQRPYPDFQTRIPPVIGASRAKIVYAIETTGSPARNETRGITEDINAKFEDTNRQFKTRGDKFPYLDNPMSSYASMFSRMS